MPQGRAGMRRGMAAALGRASEWLPTMVVDALREQWARVARLDEEVSWYRAPPEAVASGQRREPQGGGDPRCRFAGRDRFGGCDEGSRRIQVRSGVRRLAGSDDPPRRDRRQGARAWNLQAGRQVFAHHVDTRSTRRNRSRQGAARMGIAPGRATAPERGRRRPGVQGGAHDPGPAGP